MEDWAEVHRLFEREGLPKAAIARRLGMSRNTVERLLSLAEAPRYVRAPAGSQLDAFAPRIAELLAQDPTARATVIRERLRADGYRGGITILKEHLATVRPAFLAARRVYGRTAYRPGEIGQVDWWHTGAQVPVGRGRTREAFGLVTTLPFSDAHAIAFSFGMTLADVRAGLLACLVRLGGVPEVLVFDNDTSVVASGTGSRARLHPELAGLLGSLRARPLVLRPADPEAKGAVERTVGYAETSFLPLREFASLEDLQGQHDAWAAEVAWARHVRRLGGTVAERAAAERDHLFALPDPLPDIELHAEARAGRDAFVRVRDVDYSVPPAYAGRRIGIHVSPETVRLTCEGVEIARHARSFVPADVVSDPAHERAYRAARDARRRLRAGDAELPAVDLARYDALWGIGA
ncbi:MAG TPA: IS21 family transposase [Candidatus Limnocylindrales bacterium]